MYNNFPKCFLIVSHILESRTYENVYLTILVSSQIELCKSWEKVWKQFVGFFTS